MKKFYDIYDLDKRTIMCADKECDSIDIVVELNNFSTISYIEYTTAVRDQIAAQMLPWTHKKRVIFTIDIRSNEELSLDDLDQIYIFASATIVNYLCGKQRLNELRLAVKTDNINLNYSSLLKLVNYGEIDSLNIVLKNGSNIISMV